MSARPRFFRMPPSEIVRPPSTSLPPISTFAMVMPRVIGGWMAPPSTLRTTPPSEKTITAPPKRSRTTIRTKMPSGVLATTPANRIPEPSLAFATPARWPPRRFETTSQSAFCLPGRAALRHGHPARRHRRATLSLDPGVVQFRQHYPNLLFWSADCPNPQRVARQTRLGKSHVSRSAQPLRVGTTRAPVKLGHYHFGRSFDADFHKTLKLVLIEHDHFIPARPFLPDFVKLHGGADVAPAGFRSLSPCGVSHKFKVHVGKHLGPSASEERRVGKECRSRWA